MQNELPFQVRRFGGLGVLIVAFAGLGGCVTAPPPMVITPATPPTVVYQAPPTVVQTVPAQPTAPVQAPPAQTTPVAPVQPQHPAPQLSDGQVIGILTQANNAEIHEAQAAFRISSNPQVRAFARQMIIDHSHLNNRLLSLADQLGIVPTRSPESQNLSQSALRSLNQLSSLRGRNFDMAYIRHQVAIHRNLLNGINRVLLPNTRQPALRTTLLQIRPVLGSHLQRARDLLMALPPR